MASIESMMIRASAGSGKTWQLAMRYIALMVLGVKPERIIALTFTKKAAGEFTERILMSVAQAASNKTEAEELRANLTHVILGDKNSVGLVEGKIDLPRMDQALFQTILLKLTSALHRLSLSTLDSFFVKLLKNFSLELGISGFEMVDEDLLKREKVETLQHLFQSALSEQQKKAFVAAYQSSTLGTDQLRLYQTLDEFLGKYHGLLKNYPDLKQWGQREELWPNGRWSLPAGGQYVERADLVRRLLEEQGACSITRKGYDASILKLCDWVEQRAGAAGTSLTDAPPRFAHFVERLEALRLGKQAGEFHKKPILFSPKLSRALFEMVGAVIADEVTVKLEQTSGVGLLVYGFEKEYHKRVRASGRLGFSDIPLVLNADNGFFDKVARELVDYRFDERYDHWMLDEFQDTSRDQWQTISGLIDEIMATKEEGRSLFVVGDQKQSVYQWRGGDPQLFDDLLESYNHRGDRVFLHEMPLDHSFRSSSEVLGLVNEVFVHSSMSEFPPDSLRRWQFKTHETKRDDLKGQSLVISVKKDEKFDWVGKIIEKLEITKRDISCAILLRNNKQIKEVVAYLREHYPELPVAAEDKTQAAADNPVTAAIMDWFRYLAYPKDSLALEHVRMSPLGEIVLGEKSDTFHWFDAIRQLANQGISECLGEWIRALREKVNFSAFTESRLRGLMQLASEFEVRGGHDLEQWHKTMVDWNLREVTRGGVVQVLTVHRSKGLGFDAVIMPELGGEAFTNLNKLHREGVLKIDDRGLIRPITPKYLSAEPLLNEARTHWEADVCYDAFCVFYVMMTRAKRANYLLVNPGKTQKSLNMQDWLLRTIGIEGNELSMGALKGLELYHTGNWDWVECYKTKEKKEEKVECRIVLPPSRESQRLQLTGAESEVKLTSAMIASRLKNYNKMKFGDRVHACFETIHWWNGELNWDGDDNVKQIVAECMDSASIYPYFNEVEGVSVYREQSVEGMVNDVWVSGVIDRLLLKKNASGEVESAVIIDLKTNSVSDFQELEDLYRNQLYRYQDLMMHCYYLDRKEVYCVILSTHLREAKLLDPAEDLV